MKLLFPGSINEVMKQIRSLYGRWYAAVSNRVVYFFAGIFALLLVLAWWQTSETMRTVITVIGVLHLLGIAFREVWRAEYATLMLISYPVGRVVSLFILALVYFLVLFPIGLMRNRRFESGWRDPEDSFDESKMYG